MEDKTDHKEKKKEKEEKNNRKEKEEGVFVKGLGRKFVSS